MRQPDRHLRHHGRQGRLRDVGRVLGMSYGLFDGISKLVPTSRGSPIRWTYPPDPKKEATRNNYALELEPLTGGAGAKGGRRQDLSSTWRKSSRV
jgi:hypothetical protein